MVCNARGTLSQLLLRYEEVLLYIYIYNCSHFIKLIESVIQPPFMGYQLTSIDLHLHYIYVLRLTDKGSYYQGVLDRESNVQTVATCWIFSCKTPG